MLGNTVFEVEANTDDSADKMGRALSSLLGYQRIPSSLNAVASSENGDLRVLSGHLALARGLRLRSGKTRQKALHDTLAPQASDRAPTSCGTPNCAGPYSPRVKLASGRGRDAARFSGRPPRRASRDNHKNGGRMESISRYSCNPAIMRAARILLPLVLASCGNFTSSKFDISTSRPKEITTNMLFS